MIWRRWVTESSSSATQASSDHLDRRLRNTRMRPPQKRLSSSRLLGSDPLLMKHCFCPSARMTGNTEVVAVQSRLLVRDSSVTASAFTGTDSRKTFRPPTTSFLKAYSSAVAIDGGFQYGPTSHDPTRALGGVDGVGAFGGTGTRVNGCPSPSDVSNSAF